MPPQLGTKRRKTGGVQPSGPPQQAVAVKLHKRHPGQQRIADCETRHRVVMCGRQFGKTAFGIREASDCAIAGGFVGWFAPNYKIALEAWRELIERLAPITSRLNEQDKRLELVTGGVIEVWSLDTPDAGRSRKYALIVIDEAGLVRDLLGIWRNALRATLLFYQGRALFLGTPKGRRHGFVVLFNRGLDGSDDEWQSFRAATAENPYIPREEIESARKELPPEVFAQEFEGVPTDDGANPFGLEAIRQCVRPCGEVMEDDTVRLQPAVVYGIDLARSIDYTAVIGLDAWARVVYCERWQAPWAVTKAKIKALCGDTPAVADATGVGDAIVADLQDMGVLVTPHVFTQHSKLRLMQRLVATFQSKLLSLPPEDEHAWLPAELVVETDAPFLAPMPHRGKRCEPGYVAHSLQLIAELRGQRVEDVAAWTTRNANLLFRLPAITA